MAPRAGVAYAEIVPKLADGFAKDLERQVSNPVHDTSERVGGSITGLAGKIAGIAAGGFAAKGIFDFAKGAVAQAADSNKIAAQTEAVLKSTGGAAKVTAGQIGDLATAISNKTGVDDEAIQKGENLLLTFTNIHNAAGKNNDIFNQATKIAVDMGAALGGDASSNAIQLGKALNDPVAGISALTRVGVTFTQAQKDQIAAMAKAGDTMGGQKIILAELNKEFGGSAAAQGTAADRLKVTWGNVQEQLGNALLPVLNKVATFLADNLPKAMAFVSAAVEHIRPIIDGITKAFGDGGLGGVLGYLANKLMDAWPAIREALGTMLAAIGHWITDTALPYLRDHFPLWIKALWEWIVKVTPPALRALGELIAKIGVWLWQTGLPELGKKLWDLTKALWKWIQDAAPPALEKLGEWLGELGRWLLTTGIPKAAEWLAQMAGKFVDWITDLIPKIPPKLAEFLGKIGAWVVTDAIPKFIEFSGKLSEKILGFLVQAAKDAPGHLADFIGSIAKWLSENAPRLIGEAVGKIVDVILSPFKAMFNMIAGFWNDTVGSVSFSVPDWVPLAGGKGFSFPKMPIAKAMGGPIDPGVPYLVGERGPEVRVFDRGGSILTNAELVNLRRGSSGSGGQAFHIEINNPVPEPATVSIPRAIRRAAVALGSR